jgi:hypothetical protein
MRSSSFDKLRMRISLVAALVMPGEVKSGVLPPWRPAPPR